MPILQAFPDTDPLSANWLRAAFESAADLAISTGAELPTTALTSFIRDPANDGRARRLAWEWVNRQSPEVAQQLIPKMLFDPVPEFRRDAVTLLIKEGQEALEQGDRDTARRIFERALQAAIHDDQVSAIVKPLRELGHEVDLPRHFGFLTDWWIAGPFDNKDGVGFAAAYAPEHSIDLQAEMDGQQGKVRWQKLTTNDDYGKLDIARQLENFKGSCMYATTVFNSPKTQRVQIRINTPNAWKLWVNGRLVFGHEEYHRAPESVVMDLYRVPVELRAGENRILLKVCQNEQTQDWAQRYEFQLRIADATGAGVRPAADPEATPSR